MLTYPTENRNLWLSSLGRLTNCLAVYFNDNCYPDYLDYCDDYPCQFLKDIFRWTKSNVNIMFYIEYVGYVSEVDEKQRKRIGVSNT